MTARQAPVTEPVMAPGEVAAAFHVDPKTISRWRIAGKLRSVRTLGGQHRYLASDIRRMLTVEDDAAPAVDERAERIVRAIEAERAECLATGCDTQPYDRGILYGLAVAARIARDAS